MIVAVDRIVATRPHRVLDRSVLRHIDVHLAGRKHPHNLLVLEVRLDVRRMRQRSIICVRTNEEQRPDRYNDTFTFSYDHDSYSRFV